MIALDTNILVRFIVQDDPKQTASAIGLLSSRGETFFVADLVLAELVWLLPSRYGFSRVEVVEVLRAFLSRADFITEDEERVTNAVEAYAKGGDFADELIYSQAATHDCVSLASFDEQLVKRHPHFVRKPR